jgi:hypothetical protein
MPAVPAALISMITKNVSDNIKKLSGKSPLETKAAPYFTQMCKAIGMGIASGTQTLTFETKDQGFKGEPPVPGVGMGMGLEVDADYMSEKIYTNIRKSILKRYKKTSHNPWPPESENSGEFLKAFSDGIAKAVKEHYKTSWVLNSNHPLIYSGSAKCDKFKGVQAPAVKSIILANKGSLKGPFFADFAEGVAKGYQDTIEKKTTGKVTITGICIIIVPPAGFQMCGIPATGKSTGIAS